MDSRDRDTLNYKNLTQAMKYEAVSIVTALKNHITAHFYDMFNKVSAGYIYTFFRYVNEFTFTYLFF